MKPGNLYDLLDLAWRYLALLVAYLLCAKVIDAVVRILQ